MLMDLVPSNAAKKEGIFYACGFDSKREREQIKSFIVGGVTLRNARGGELEEETREAESWHFDIFWNDVA